MTVLFWDFDGTLVVHTHLWSECVHRALLETQPDSPVTFDRIRSCLSHGFTWHTPEEDYTGIRGDKWWEHMNRHFYQSYLECGVPETKAKTATEKIRGLIKLPENYFLFEDTLKTLEAVQNLGYTNVILSNNYPDMAEVVDALGLTKYFDGLIVSAVEGYDKPRPELFEIAKKRFPAEKYYMIGDNPKADILGGKNAGMTTILVHKEPAKEADHCFPDLSSIIELLKPPENV